MKRPLLCSIFMLASFFASAQTQQGYVKTKGRMDAKGNIIPGQGLNGATVSVQGRTTVLVNTDDGAFSFPAPEAQFRLDSVRKKGYQLVDMDACPRTYKYSSNPLYLVMETPEQQLQDQLAAQRKIRRTLEKQLREREDEIEALKEQQKISDEEYRQALQKLYEDTDQNEQLVKDMVERYSKIDYDQLSEFDQLISNYILNGELTKADSLLRTKGDINERISQYKKHEAINAKEREELSQRQNQLEQSEALAIQERDDLANDLYHKFEIFKMQHENDSAAYYIELRAGLDTTNVEWIEETGCFFLEYIADYVKALQYYEMELRQSLLQYSEYSTESGSSYNNIGLTYYYKGFYDEALEYYDKAMHIWSSVLGKNHTYVATSYNNIGNVYLRSDYNKALEYHDMALNIRKNVFGENHEHVAISYMNKGVIYSYLDEYERALECFKNASDIINVLGVDDPKYATLNNNLGSVLIDLEKYDEALEYLDKALHIQLNTYGENHPLVATTYHNIGRLYYKKGDYDNAIEYYYKALRIKATALDENHPDIASSFNNIANLFADKGDYEKAIEYYNKALCIWTNAINDHNPDVAAAYYNIGSVYMDKGEYDKSLEYYNKALLIWRENFGSEHAYTKHAEKIISEIEAKLKKSQEK